MLSLYIWAISGLVLMLLELIIPGGVIVFLGMGCLTVAGGIYFGLISNIVYAILTFFISSLIYLLILRSLFMKYFEGDSTIEDIDEDNESMNSIVEVIEEITPFQEGRVKFRDTTWTAMSDHKIRVGEKAIIKKRIENKWFVEPIN